jgi:hypothetical protein
VVLKEPDPKVYGIRGDGNRVQAIEAQFSVQYTALVGYAPFSFRTYMDVGGSK